MSIGSWLSSLFGGSKETADSSGIEQKVVDFMDEEPDWGDIRTRDPHEGEPELLIMRNAIREQVVPSFLIRYHSLLDQSPTPDLRKIVYKLFFAPTLIDERGDRRREMGNEILTLFESYMSIDTAWIKMIGNSVQKFNFRESRNSSGWKGRPFLYLALSLLDDSVIELAKEYSEKSEDVKSVVLNHVSDAAIGQYPTRDVSFITRIYGPLGQEEVGVFVYEQVYRFLKRITKELHGKRRGGTTAEEYGVYKDISKERLERFVQAFSRERLDAMKQRGFGPEFWVTIADMTAYDDQESVDAATVEKTQVVAYRESQHHRLCEEVRAYVGTTFSSWKPTTVSRGRDALEVVEPDVDRYIEKTRMTATEGRTPEQIMNDFELADTKLRRFRGCFGKRSYRDNFSSWFKKEERVLVAAIAADSVGQEIFDAFIDLHRNPDKIKMDYLE